MSNEEEQIIEARQEFEAALQKWVRLSRGDKGYFFIQDYAVAVSSESMEPGQENMTYMNSIARPGMAGYQVVGLLQSSLHNWLFGSRNE